VSLPVPKPGLVVRYAYLWESEAREGREEAPAGPTRYFFAPLTGSFTASIVDNSTL